MAHNKKESVAFSSVVASFLLTAMKLVVGIMTGSMGIISEAAHSALDLGAALLTFFAVRVSDKPADPEHPYGHGKIESVSALIETGLLFLTSAWIIYESIHRLIDKNVEVEVTWYAFAVIIISIIIDISRSRALNRVAKETKSQALEADALHFSSDIYSSLVVLVGLVCVAFDVKGADSIAAICVSMFVLHAGYVLGKRTIDVLVDTAPEGIPEIVKEAAGSVVGVIAVDRVRARPLGASVFIDMTIKIGRKLPVEKANEIVKQVEENIHAKIPEADVVIHTKATHLTNETIVEIVQLLAAKQDLTVHDIIVDALGKQKHISYDLEVPEEWTLEKAHREATVLEKIIIAELGGDVQLSSHIEPLKSEIVTSTKVSKDEERMIGNLIAQSIKGVKRLTDVHDISIKKIGKELFITLHCIIDKKSTVETAHEASTKLEFLIKEKIPNVKRVVVHVETSRNDS